MTGLIWEEPPSEEPSHLDDIRHVALFGKDRGANPNWKPQKKTLEKIAHVLEVLAEFKQFWPVPLRSVQYRMVGRFGYVKSDVEFEAIQYAVDRGRRAGRISWSAVDDGRSSVSEPFEFEDADGFSGWLENVIDETQLPRQAGQPQYVELWCEAAGTVARLEELAHEFGVPVYTSSGYNTTTSRYRAAVRAVRRDRESPAGRRTHILHLGDHDSDGVKLFNALLEDVEAWVADLGHPGIVTVERVAILPSQIEEHVPPRLWERPKRKWKWWPWRYAAQLEALDLPTLHRIIRRRLEELFDLDVLEEVKRGEEDFRNELRQQIQS